MYVNKVYIYIHVVHFYKFDVSYIYIYTVRKEYFISFDLLEKLGAKRIVGLYNYIDFA
jgi:hypothetical protein